MRTLKVIDETLDEWRAELEGMIGKAKSEGRDLTHVELARLKTAEIEVPRLQSERREVKDGMRKIMASSNPNAINPSIHDSRAHSLTLPRNGVLPGDEQQRYSSIARVGKLRAFRDDQTAYDCGQWLRAVVSREFQHGIDHHAEDYCGRVGFEITNVGHEGSGPAGGYLVPAPLSSTIIDVKERVGVSRQVCRVLPATGDSLTVPRRAGGLTVYYPNEGGLIDDSDKLWAAVSLGIKKRAVASYLTNELVDDALINIVDDTILEMAYALALQEDNELINGTAASTYGGVQGLLASIGTAGVSTAATGHDTWGELDIADLTACVGKLPDRYHVYGPGWICSHSFFNQVMARIAYNAGGVSMAEVMGGTPNVRSFLGYPVYLTPHMPTATAVSTKCALFGSFTQAAILADRGGVRIGRSDDYKFLEDKVTLRATSRYDIEVFDAGDSSNAGAYVALATAS